MKSSKIKIAFLWYWNPDYTQATVWEDGLAGALKELIKRGHDVKIFTTGAKTTIRHPYFDIHVTDEVVKDIGEFDPDVILHWADMTRPHAVPLKALQKPMAICFAGGEPISYNTEIFDHIFVESLVYEAVFSRNGFSVSRAFGTNTELFKPQQQVKVFDTIFPATFARWKRHELYAQATNGLKSLAIGYMYDKHETDCWQVCLDNGVMVLPHLPYHALPRLFASARVMVIPSQSDGGSQRTVLEAMAMNMPVVVADSDKFDFAEGKVFKAEPSVKELGDMIRMALESEVVTRPYIQENWSEFSYADSLEEGLRNIL